MSRLIKNIPEGWKAKYFDELFEFKNGINADKASYGEGGVKFINVMEIIYNNSITNDMIPGSVKIRDDQKKLYSVVEGDVLFNRTSETTEEIGLSAVYYGKEEVVFGGFVIRGRSKGEQIDIDFKKYCFKSDYVRKQIIVRGQGAVRSNIGQGDLGTVSIVLPSLPEQQKIASILSKWDELIELQTQLIEEKEKQKKGLMQKLFPQEGEKAPKYRFQKFEKDGEWEIDIVDNLVSTVTPPRKLTSSNYQEKGKFPIIDQSKSFYCGWTNDIDAVITDNLPLIIFGDHTCILKMTNEPFVQGADGIKILKTKSKIIPEFLYQYLQHNEVKLEDYKRHFSILKEKYVLFPKKENGEQQKIISILSAIDNEIQSLKDKLESIKLQKKGLMQQLLTGKIRVKV